MPPKASAASHAASPKPDGRAPKAAKAKTKGRKGDVKLEANRSRDSGNTDSSKMHENTAGDETDVPDIE